MPRLIHELLLKGQNVLVRGQKSSYVVTKAFKQSVFQAHIQGTSTPVIIKAESNPLPYKHEVAAYGFDCIRASPYIRALHEAIDNGTDKCMVLEWMDSDIWTIRHQARPVNSPLLKVIAKSVLQALTALNHMDEGGVVHSDVNPNNILVSGPESSSPTVKLGDLEGIISATERIESRTQGLAIRAPEMWTETALSPACDVWSLGVSLAHFLASKTLFGPSDMNIMLRSRSHETTQAAWCIGKMIRLIGPWRWDGDPKFKDEFELGEALVNLNYIKIRSLRDELGSVGVSGDCVDFLYYLLDTNPNERPTAAQALEHPWLKSIP